MDAIIDLFSNPDKVKIVLQSISAYAIYIYPGIISIYWNNFLDAKSTKDTQALIIKSFSISFLYNIILDNFFQYNINTIECNIRLIIVSIISPYIYYRFKYSKINKFICIFLGIRTCISGVPFELLKDTEEKYTCLKVYLSDNNTVYIGYMSKYEYEDNKEKFIILSGYKKYIIKNGDERLIVNNEAEEYDQKVFIKYSDIKVIEKISEDTANKTIYYQK